MNATMRRVTRENGESWCWFATFPRTFAGYRVAIKTARQCQAYYNGPGRAFSNGPSLCAKGSRVLVQAWAGLDV
jgi:hypothetical protein